MFFLLFGLTFSKTNVRTTTFTILFYLNVEMAALTLCDHFFSAVQRIYIDVCVCVCTLNIVAYFSFDEHIFFTALLTAFVLALCMNIPV